MAITLILYRYHRQRPYSTNISDATIDEAWDQWLNGPLTEDEERLRRELLDALDRRTLDAIREDLREFERKVLGGRYPLTAIRREIMDSVDRRMLNTEILKLSPDLKQRLRARNPELIQSDRYARTYIAANELRLAVLREFGAKRYGDRAPADWYAVYERASRLKQRTARLYINKGLEEDGLNLDDGRQEAISMVDTQLKYRLLQVPPGVSFDRLQPDAAKREAARRTDEDPPRDAEVREPREHE